MKQTGCILLLISCLIWMDLPFVRAAAPSSGVPYDNKVAVLIYHHIHASDQSPGTITPQLFRAQLEHLQKRGYRFITMNQFRQFMTGGTVPPKAALVTFDDGYESFFTSAFPVLRELRIPAVHFLITHKIERSSSEFKYAPLRKEQIQHMADSGLVEFQCHTDNQHRLVGNDSVLRTKLTMNNQPESDENYRQRIAEDTLRNMSKIEALANNPADTFAYPYGYYHEPLVRILQESGIRLAFTTKPGLARREANRMELPRIQAGSPTIDPATLEHTIRQLAEKLL